MSSLSFLVVGLSLVHGRELGHVSSGAPIVALRFRGGGEGASPSCSSVRSQMMRPRGGEVSNIGKPDLDASKQLKLLIGAAGIFFSFSIFAILQEDVYKKAYGGEYFASTFFALVLERGVNALSAVFGNKMLGGSGLIIPKVEIFQSGVAQMLAMAGSNEALRYVSYPTQVLGKSCKMVPVMAGGIVLGGKTYSIVEYIQVLMITAGVCVFNFGGSKKKVGKKDSPYGLGLIALSLLMDAATGGLQDKTKKRTRELNPMVSNAKPTMHETMFWTNISGCLIAFLFAILSGHMMSGIKFCRAHPEVLKAILVYSLSSAVGQQFVYYVVTEFNPLILTTVTTTRKIFSTLLSVFRNPENSLNPMQWGGCSMVFAGLLGDIVRKKIKSSPPTQPPKTCIEDPQVQDSATVDVSEAPVGGNAHLA